MDPLDGADEVINLPTCGPLWAGPQQCRAADHVSSGPQLGKLAKSHLLGSPKLPSSVQDQSWLTSGYIAHMDPSVRRVPNPSHRWTKSLGPQVGRLATSPPPFGGSAMLKCVEQNEQRPKSGHIVSITPTSWSRGQSPNAGAKMSHGRQVEGLATSPTPFAPPPPPHNDCERGTKSSAAYKRTYCLHRPDQLEPNPKLQCRGDNEPWPTSGHIGYIIPAVWG